MEDQHFWDVAFITVAGIQFHPRNEGSLEKDKMLVKRAARIADEMLKEKQRCQSGVQ